MKVLLCPDSFKGALGAPEAAAALAEGWKRVFPEAECVCLPVADGGEGTLDVLLAATGGERFLTEVTGPLGEPVQAAWGLLPDGTAVIELAQAAGLSLVPPSKRDPKKTTTYGVGELLLRATRKTNKLLITLGGSATNDGGAGILEAFLNYFEPTLEPGGAALRRLRGFYGSPKQLVGYDVRIACDVDNPLTGPQGASAVFGPQKGATPKDVELLDAALANFAGVLGLPEEPGDGAAGGAAYGLRWLFPGARLVPGIELVLDALGFDQHLADASLVLTGEGRLDSQTLGGKVIAGVARRAKAHGVPVAAIVGGLESSVSGAALQGAGVAAVLPLAPGPCTLAESMEHTAAWLTDAAERAARWVALGQAGKSQKDGE
jgi:glycerate kinase